MASNAEAKEAEEAAAAVVELEGASSVVISSSTPQMSWSETPCTFDEKDHPTVIPKECYALVVSPRIDGYDLSKCLMDGGASLNIMYLETLERMNLTKEQLKHSTTEFHGVVPGKKANSLGSIRLPVAFGDANNFRQEMITFEVVPFKSSYHVIFGRPTYHKFHARACYIYNKLKIPGPKDGIEILREIHAGIAGITPLPGPLVAKAFRLGFYWLTAKEDADKLVKTCRGCQYYATQPNAPAQELKTIPITWPFAVWGLDMVGKLKKSSPGGFEYLLVAIDKFSKWIEATPVRKADGATALKFVCSLVTRFGIPHSIITNNGTNFAQGELKDYCHDVGIRLDLASVAHPQSNGQVERANGLLLSGIKPRLEEMRRAAGAWGGVRLRPVEFNNYPNSQQIHSVLPVYGSAVLPSDIIHDSPRVSAYDEETADEADTYLVDRSKKSELSTNAPPFTSRLRYHSRQSGIARSWPETWFSAFAR
ncbi:hypothetical protein QYE76_060935 [Lolium multiflorum]|uniref:Integrase catalytic domain-containing protein n=1 Tax=Lolium multiflorum TaxID=4521 RepID=A0AAD8W5W5_LOLMU|nr:hypothetical protein QYE76_060935 [Lolium multiflorum]